MGHSRRTRNARVCCANVTVLRLRTSDCGVVGCVQRSIPDMDDEYISKSSVNTFINCLLSPCAAAPAVNETTGARSALCKY